MTAETLQQPGDFIGEISRWENGIAIPVPSRNYDEAMRRYESGDIYSESPVEIGQFENQTKLLSIFRNKSYADSIVFSLNSDTGKLGLYDPNKSYELHLKRHYPKRVLDKIAKLLAPTTEKILIDFTDFEGSSMSLDVPELLIELRGGRYSNQGAKDVTVPDLHRDGPTKPPAIAYIGSFVDPGELPLNTLVVPGVYNSDESTAQVLAYGVEPTQTAPGGIHRLGPLEKTWHAAPPQELEEKRARFFMRALVRPRTK